MATSSEPLMRSRQRIASMASPRQMILFAVRSLDLIPVSLAGIFNCLLSFFFVFLNNFSCTLAELSYPYGGWRRRWRRQWCNRIEVSHLHEVQMFKSPYFTNWWNFRKSFVVKINEFLQEIKFLELGKLLNGRFLFFHYWWSCLVNIHYPAIS